MIRGMGRAQAEYDAMLPPDDYEDAAEVEEDDPDNANELQAQYDREDAEGTWRDGE